jgi:hypothetical protein
MRAIFILAAAALAGCAAKPQQLRETAPQASDFKICRAAFLAPQDVASIAKEEAQRRGLDCTPYAAAILQNEQMSDAAKNDFIRSLQQQHGQRQLIAPPVSCTSRKVGSTVQTDCQ